MDGSRGMRGQTSELLRDGVVVLPEYLAPDRLATLRAAVEDLLEGGGDRTAGAAAGRADGTLTVSGDPDRPGITEIAGAHHGSEALDDLRDEAVPEGIVNGCTDEFHRAATLDVRIATGPTDPDPYHLADDAFLAVAYLTEVRDVGDGPFAYLHGSHTESAPKRRLGSLIDRLFDVGTGEAAFHDESDGTAHPGPAGTLVVADGRGYHRFLPTHEGRRSVIAVAKFRPVDLGPLDPDDDGWDEDWDEMDAGYDDGNGDEE